MQARRRPSFTPLAAAAVAVLVLALPTFGHASAEDGELEAAREELRLRTETERRMRRDFETLLAEGRMTATEITDFEHYLASLGMLVDEQRRAVARLAGEGTDAAAGSSAPLPADFDRGQTDEEKTALLDAELGSSLSEFDEKLLREQQELAEKSRDASTGAPGQKPGEPGADAREGGADGQQESTAEGGDAAGKGAGESADGGEAGRPGQESGGPAEGVASEPGDQAPEAGEQVASTGGEGEAAGRSGNARVPPDIPDGKDDDVVARQLREAAENEQDPELREKLWEEYRRYKGSPR